MLNPSNCSNGLPPWDSSGLLLFLLRTSSVTFDRFSADLVADFKFIRVLLMIMGLGGNMKDSYVMLLISSSGVTQKGGVGESGVSFD